MRCHDDVADQAIILASSSFLEADEEEIRRNCARKLKQYTYNYMYNACDEER